MKIKKHQEALCTTPVTQAELTACSKGLVRAGFCEIPKSYANFLAQTNGYAWNGYEFYGTLTVEEDGTGYRLMDIITQNIGFDNNYGVCGKLLLGRFDIAYYVYNSASGKYEELDSDSPELDVMTEFDTFEELLDAIHL